MLCWPGRESRPACTSDGARTELLAGGRDSGVELGTDGVHLVLCIGHVGHSGRVRLLHARQVLLRRLQIAAEAVDVVQPSSGLDLLGVVLELLDGVGVLVELADHADDSADVDVVLDTSAEPLDGLVDASHLYFDRLVAPAGHQVQDEQSSDDDQHDQDGVERVFHGHGRLFLRCTSGTSVSRRRMNEE